MKTNTTRAALAAAFLLLPSSVLLAQGPLTPPGAPAPTMKTLDQIEARTPISSAPFTIGSPGSYYLTGNLSVTTGNAITINADDVTLDLNGFTISSTASPASGTAVLLSGTRSSVAITNGHIRGTTTVAGSTFTAGGFLDGVAQSSTTSTAVRVADLHIVGLGRSGIDFGSLFTATLSTFLVERCFVDICPTFGIEAYNVRDCVATNIGNTAITTRIVTNSYGQSVGTGAGILGPYTAQNCRGVAVSGVAISATNVHNCQGNSSSNTGINAAIASNCLAVSVSGTGMVSDNATNCSAFSTSGPFGMSVTGTASFCVGKRDGGVAISAVIAIGCTVSGTGSVTSANKFLGTP